MELQAWLWIDGVFSSMPKVSESPSGFGASEDEPLHVGGEQRTKHEEGPFGFRSYCSIWGEFLSVCCNNFVLE